MRLALTAARSIVPRAVLLAFCLLNARCTHARTPPPATTEEASVTLTPIARQLDQLRSAFIEEVPAGNALSPERIAEVIAHGKAMMADNAILLDQPRLVITRFRSSGCFRPERARGVSVLSTRRPSHAIEWISTGRARYARCSPSASHGPPFRSLAFNGIRSHLLKSKVIRKR